MSYTLVIVAACYRNPSNGLIAAATDALGAIEEICPDTERCPSSPPVEPRPVIVWHTSDPCA